MIVEVIGIEEYYLPPTRAMRETRLVLDAANSHP